MNFMLFIAEELREIMAKLGFRKVEDMVGRTDFLRVKAKQATKRAETVDMQAIINPAYAHSGKNPL